MPTVRVPVRRSGYRYTARPGRRYPVRPIVTPAPAPARRGGLAGLLGGLAGLLLCLLCLLTLGLIGLFSAFVAVTAYLGQIHDALEDINSSSVLYVNMAVLLGALCFGVFHKFSRFL